MHIHTENKKRRKEKERRGGRDMGEAPVSRYWNLEANGPVCSTGLTSSLLRSAGRHTS